ncbi:hypothetical protein PN498_11805 [Oscillatoria sp. CS-180]|uniref:Tic22 family protein n=1 Tax=Oscillatoria sp. CS-180 TaxID=3021720 RepID=UPI00233129C2|nr:Tic22 family protein [Oscillatoria sp. CS-180]MDB9526677.1 hypothetical protein [Oscillatoria sp. CS-180]
MQNKIYRQLTSVGLASVATATSVLLAPGSAFALSEQEILEKLDRIPVFLVVDDAGQPLTVSLETEEEAVPSPVVFIDSTEAEAFVEEAESGEAEFTDDVQIAILSLSDVYAEANAQLDSADSLVYIPSAQSLYLASEISNQEIQGVPLYAAVDLERNQYLLTGENTLPMFFSLQDLRSQVQSLVAVNPDIEDSIGVEVTTFETVLSSMAADDPESDPLMELVEFIPSSQTLEYVRSLAESAPDGEAPAESAPDSETPAE